MHFSLCVFASLPGIADTTDVVEDADHVALRAASVGKPGRVANLRIAPLRARAMNIH